MLDQFYGVCIVDHDNENILIGESDKVAVYITENTKGYLYGKISKRDPNMYQKLKEMAEQAAQEHKYKALLCP